MQYAFAIIYCIISFAIIYAIIKFISFIFCVSFPFWFIVTVWGISSILLIISSMDE